MSTSDPRVAAVVATYQSQAARLRRRSLVVLAGLWSALPAYNRVDMDGYVERVVPFMESAQAATAALTVGYLGLLERVVFGSVEGIVTPLELSSTEALRGVSAGEVWRRPGVEVWSLLSQGVLYAEAVRRGGQRAQQIGATNMQLAKTHAARHVTSNSTRIVGYRRVLGGRKPCALCVSASSRTYHKADLLPVHVDCSCNVLPIYGTGRSGRSRGGDAETPGVKVEDHGEFGPILIPS